MDVSIRNQNHADDFIGHRWFVVPLVSVPHACPALLTTGDG